MRKILLSLALAASFAPTAKAEVFFAGGDLYFSGSSGDEVPAAGRDLFAAGFSLRLDAPVAEDAHVAGGSVEIDGEIGGDLMAAGGRVRIGAPVGGDISVSGFSVETDAAAGIEGNVRISGASVALRGPIGGALVASGGEVILDASVDGDAWLTGGTIRFEEGARVSGMLHYSAPERIDIPSDVAPASRISFRPLDPGRARMAENWAEDWEWEGPGRGTLLAGFLTTVAFFVAMGAIFLAFAPNTVETLERRIAARPGLALLAGVVGLGAAIGLVPITALTVIGIPLVPIVLLGILLLWVAGYLLGIFAVSLKVLRSFGAGAEPGITAKLAALGVGVAVAALLNFVPVLGWIANFAVLLVGIGAVVLLIADPAPSRA